MTNEEILKAMHERGAAGYGTAMDLARADERQKMKKQVCTCCLERIFKEAFMTNEEIISMCDKGEALEYDYGATVTHIDNIPELLKLARQDEREKLSIEIENLKSKIERQITH